MSSIGKIYKKNKLPLPTIGKELTLCKNGKVSTSGFCNWNGGRKGKYVVPGNFETCKLLGYQYSAAVLVPLGEVFTREDIFQNRETAFSSDSSNKIIKAVKTGVFRWEVFDPIVLWLDTKGQLSVKNRLYVLSGHSRTAAFRKLSDLYKGKDFDRIPAKILKGVNLETAIDIALNSNTLGTPETEVERAFYYKRMRTKGISEKEIEKAVRTNEGNNWSNIYYFSFLNSNGKSAFLLGTMQGKDDTSLNNARSIGNWIGRAMRKFEGLTNQHENELYEYLMKVYGKQFSNYNQFLEKVQNVVRVRQEVANWQDKPLNIANLTIQSDVELNFKRQLQEQKRVIKDLEKVRDSKLKQLINRKAKQDDIERIMNKLDMQIRVQKGKLIKLQRQEKTVKQSAAAQTNLFAVSGMKINKSYLL